MDPKNPMGTWASIKKEFNNRFEGQILANNPKPRIARTLHPLYNRRQLLLSRTAAEGAVSVFNAKPPRKVRAEKAKQTDLRVKDEDYLEKE